MKDIESIVTDALAEYNLFTCFLFRFSDGTTTYRYTDLDVPIYWAEDGTNVNYFEPRNIIPGTVNYSIENIVDDTSITIDNRDSVMTSIFGASDDFQGQEGKIWIAILDANAQTVGTVVLFNGSLDSFDLTEEEIDLSIVSLFYEWNRSVKHRQPSRCRYKVFKGTQCKYAGAETSCDRRYEICSSYGNQANFGGFRWLPKIENKTFKWGPGGEISIL